MLRRVGYNTVLFNDAPYAASGRYVASDALASGWDITTLQVSDTQSLQYDIAPETSGEVSISYEMRQLALQSLAAGSDITYPLPSSASSELSWDITTPAGMALQAAYYGVAMGADESGASLSGLAGDAVMTPAGGGGLLAEVTAHAVLSGNEAHATLTRIH